VLLCKPDELPKSPGCVLIFGISAQCLNYGRWADTTSPQKMRCYVSQIEQTSFRIFKSFIPNKRTLLT